MQNINSNSKLQVSVLVTQGRYNLSLMKLLEKFSDFFFLHLQTFDIVASSPSANLLFALLFALCVTVDWTSATEPFTKTAYGGSKRLNSFEGHDIMGINLQEKRASTHLYNLQWSSLIYFIFIRRKHTCIAKRLPVHLLTTCISNWTPRDTLSVHRQLKYLVNGSGRRSKVNAGFNRHKKKRTTTLKCAVQRLGFGLEAPNPSLFCAHITSSHVI